MTAPRPVHPAPTDRMPFASGTPPRPAALFILVGVLLSALFSACAGSGRGPLVEREAFGRPFEEAGVEGTFVLYDLQADRYLVHDAERARTRFIPASTFKIVNSLIALETGSIADTATVLAWDGRTRDVAAWNRDHSMTTAFRYSVVWYYQEAARRIGAERMRAYLQRLGYGNADIGGGIDRFWLDGALRISAVEQVDLLVRLYRDDLPFAQSTLDAVKGIMVEARGADYVLRAKTGWDGAIGWYVGYVERAGRPYFFALNMELPHVEQAPLRQEIARTILRDLGLLRGDLRGSRRG